MGTPTPTPILTALFELGDGRVDGEGDGVDDVDRGRSDERREEEVLATSGGDDVDVLGNEMLVDVLDAVVAVRTLHALHALHALDRLNTLDDDLIIGDLTVVKIFGCPRNVLKFVALPQSQSPQQ